MDIEKLVEDLRGLLKQYGEKIPYGEMVGAPWPYSMAGDLVWQDPEPYFIEQAATALSTLQAENKRLNKIVCSIPTTPDSGRTVSQYDKEMSMCAYLDDLEAENEKLRAELNDLKDKWDKYQPREHWETLNELCENLRDELEQVKRERDSALKDLETLCRDDVGPCEMAICELCAYNSGVQCSSSDGRICDGYNVFNWKWRGPKKED